MGLWIQFSIQYQKKNSTFSSSIVLFNTKKPPTIPGEGLFA